MRATGIIVGGVLLAAAHSAFALVGYDKANKCSVEVKGNYTLETLKTKLKQGDKITIVDGCEKKTEQVEIWEVNRFETNDGVSYRLDLLDRTRMDNLRTRSVEMNPAMKDKD